MLRFADVSTDVDLVETARDVAQDLLQTAPAVVETHLNRWLGGRENYLRV
jgi:ATP-dependent DNA helicase RecG